MVYRLIKYNSISRRAYCRLCTKTSQKLKIEFDISYKAVNIINIHFLHILIVNSIFNVYQITTMKYIINYNTLQITLELFLMLRTFWESSHQ